MAQGNAVRRMGQVRREPHNSLATIDSASTASMTAQPHSAMSEDAARIAASLTDGQREALLRHPPNGHYGTPERGWPEPARDPTSWSSAGRVLKDKRLIDWCDRFGSDTRLTNLGRAVRTALDDSRRKT